MITINDLPTLIKEHKVEKTKQLQDLLKDQALYFRWNRLRVIVFPKIPYEVEDHMEQTRSFMHECDIYINERHARSLKPLPGSAGYYYRRWYEQKDKAFEHDLRCMLELDWPKLDPNNNIVEYFKGVYTGTREELEEIQENRVIPLPKDKGSKRQREKLELECRCKRTLNPKWIKARNKKKTTANKYLQICRKCGAEIEKGFPTPANPYNFKHSEIPAHKKTYLTTYEKRIRKAFEASVKEAKYWNKYNKLYNIHRDLVNTECHELFKDAIKRDKSARHIKELTEEINAYRASKGHWRGCKSLVQERVKVIEQLQKIEQLIELKSKPTIKAWEDFEKFRQSSKRPSKGNKAKRDSRREARQKLAKERRMLIRSFADTKNINKQIPNQMVCIKSSISGRLFRIPRCKAEKYVTRWFEYAEKENYKSQVRADREFSKAVAELYYKKREEEYFTTDKDNKKILKEGVKPIQNRKSRRTEIGKSKPYGNVGTRYREIQRIPIKPEKGETESVDVVELIPQYIRKASWLFFWEPSLKELKRRLEKPREGETFWANMRIRSMRDIVKLDYKTKVFVGLKRVVTKVQRQVPTTYKTIFRTMLPPKQQLRMMNAKIKWAALQEELKQQEEKNKALKEEGKE